MLFLTLVYAVFTLVDALFDTGLCCLHCFMLLLHWFMLLLHWIMLLLHWIMPFCTNMMNLIGMCRAEPHVVDGAAFRCCFY